MTAAASNGLLFPAAALLLGTMGSLHCLGMCGPIVLALPRQGGWARSVALLCAHHLGRAITYAAMGVLAGLLGKGLSLGGFQRWVSIVLGGVLILAALGQSARWRLPLPGFYLRGLGRLKAAMSARFTRGGVGTRLVFGLLNGLLPCGLVYVALAGAVATGAVWSGALFMFLFGLGTAPALIALSVGGWRAGQTLQPLLRRAIPVLTFLFGVLFLLRGLALGIPYLSPAERALHADAAQKAAPAGGCPCGGREAPGT